MFGMVMIGVKLESVVWFKSIRDLYLVGFYFSCG